MIWSSFLHIYQPPWQTKEMTKKVARQSYWRIVHILDKHPLAKITLNINGTLTEQLAAHGEAPLLRAFSALAKRGQIEFVGSAKYHAILPLIPRKEVIRQIELNNLTNKKYFGQWYNPKGFFPPEMCWDNRLAPILKQLGFEWVILDEIAVNSVLKKNNNITTACYDGVSNLHFFFRSRFASDLFTTAIVKSADHFLSLIGKRRADDMLITAFDGENLGHHSPLMDNRFEEIVEHPSIRMLTHSELFRICSIRKRVSPRASSWSSRPQDLKRGIPYPLWQYPGNALQKIQWDITNEALRFVRWGKNEKYGTAQTLLDQALSSDQYWWASAMPWWGVDELLRGTSLYLRAVEAIPSSSATTASKKIHREFSRLEYLARLWHSSGKAGKIKRAFLRHEPLERFFGGEKVK